MIHNILTILALSLYTYAGAALLNSLALAANAVVNRVRYSFSVLTPLLAAIAGHVCLVLS